MCLQHALWVEQCQIKGSMHLLKAPREFKLRVKRTKGNHSSESCATRGSNATGMLLRPRVKASFHTER